MIRCPWTMSRRAPDSLPQAFRTVIFWVCAVLIPALSSPAGAATPSFVCRNVKSWLEKTVCSSGPVAQLDLELAVARSRLLQATNPTTRKALESEQRAWWSSLNACRKRSDPHACLTGRYEQRIAAVRNHPEFPPERGVRQPEETEPAPIATAGAGWTRELSRYQRALRACKEESPSPIGKLLVAWSGQDSDTIGMRLVDWTMKEWVCVAHRNGHKVLRFAQPAPEESLPVAGPVYHLGGTKPPPTCMNAIQVVDVNGKPAGWISDRDC